MNDGNIRSATSILTELRDGQVITEMSAAIHDALSAVKEHGKAATVTLRVTITTYRPVHRVLKRAGLYERWVCRHIGRKTWATNAAVAGATDIEIGNVLQDTPAMVRKHYAISRPEKLLPVMNKVRRDVTERVIV